MSNIAFRFDVDTHKCIRDGVPNILKLAHEYDIKFTFFINLGRSVSIPNSLSLKLGSLQNRNEQSRDGKSLTALQKLGILDYFEAMTINPQIKKYKNQIRAIAYEGHEIGLHGGRNHQLWASESNHWTQKRLDTEVKWGLSQLRSLIPGYSPKGFASPSWVHPILLNQVLINNGFQYCADLRHGMTHNYEQSGSLKHPVTNITGEPGGIAIVEHLVARQHSIQEVISEIVTKFESQTVPIAYDHPYFAGVQGLPILKRIIEELVNKGFKFQTMSKLINV
jgi:peptidoglycan/xylan/chitin deacetylase (PgdA/CDA1 family)